MLVLLGLVPPADARSVRLKEPARLREGPTRFSALIADLPGGTELEVTGEQNGWLRVGGQDGRTGYVWGAHADEVPEEPPVPPQALPPARPDPTSGSAAPDPAPAAPTADTPAPHAVATAQDVERLRADIARLTDGQREIVRRLEDETAIGDGPPGLAWVYLFVGAIVGWLIGLIATRRRSRRQHQRLRIG